MEPIGITTGEDKWLDEVIQRVEPAGIFIGRRSTVEGVRSGEWHISSIGMHEPLESWEAAGKPSLLEEARAKVEYILKTHKPIPLETYVKRELERIWMKAKRSFEG